MPRRRRGGGGFNTSAGKGLAIEIGEHRIPVTVTSVGEFWAEWESDSYHSNTYAGLRSKLRSYSRRCATT